MTREVGFYWVRYLGDWICAEWGRVHDYRDPNYEAGSGWFVPGEKFTRRDEEMQEIGERVVRT